MSEAKLIAGLEKWLEDKLADVREITDNRHTDDDGVNDIHTGEVEDYVGADGYEDSLDYLAQLDSKTTLEADMIDAGVVYAVRSLQQFLKGYKDQANK